MDMNRASTKHILLGAAAGLLSAIIFPTLSQAGTLTPPAAATDPGSAMYTQEAVYKRLSTGAAGVKRSGSFAEPLSGPGATGHDLDAVMGVAPAADIVNGAIPADVVSGKTYWSLRTDGSWGNQTGTNTSSPYPASVPATGHTTCYDSLGTLISCTGTGQDGDLQIGTAWPNPRFTDNIDGTVSDNLTGLIWLKNANCAGANRNWTTALTDVAQLNTDGTINGNICGDTSNQNDWRLPNNRELSSLNDTQYYSPSLPNAAGTGKWTEGDAFSGVQSNGYWSSTTYVPSPGSAWLVYLSNGGVNVGEKINSYSVWPVRGGQ